VSDDRLTRGGPVVRRGGGRLLHGRFSSDNRRRVTVSGTYNNLTDGDGGHHHGISGSLGFRPAPNVQLSLGPSFGNTRDTRQFVLRRADETATHFFGLRTVFATIDRNTLSMNTRLNWTFSPTLSLQLFAQPFVFAGDYSRFKEFSGPGTRETRVYGEDFGSVCFQDGRYTLDPAGECAVPAERSAQAFSFANPDLNVRSLRGNAVLRWEYRPGSTLFLVWQQQRAGFEPFGDFDFRRDTGAIFGERADNIFVVKASYWLGR
jgi:hypothetical protein